MALAVENSDIELAKSASETLIVRAVFGAGMASQRKDNSNVVKGIRACVGMIRNSHNYNEDTTFDFVPFKFDGYDRKPSSFYVRFLMEGIEYEYSFSMTKHEILTEQMYYYPNGRKSLVFSRDESKGTDKRCVYDFKPLLKRPMDVAANTSRKTLFISRASTRGHPNRLFFRFSTIVSWFCTYGLIDCRQFYL